MSQKRKRLTLKEKMEVINVYETEKLSVRDMAKYFDVGKSQISNIIKSKNDILNSWTENDNKLSKRAFPKTPGLAFDYFTYEWFRRARANKLPLSGTLIRKKALEIAKELGYPDFKASGGWLDKFRVRHNISLNNISCEAGAVYHHNNTENDDRDDDSEFTITGRQATEERKNKGKESGEEEVVVQSVDTIEMMSDQSLGGGEESNIMDKTDLSTDDQDGDSLKPAVQRLRNKATTAGRRSQEPEDTDVSTASDVAETKTEFDVFGSSVAAQLKSMPWENAIELQLQIQQLITRYRLNLHKESRTNSSKRPPFELVECGEEPIMGYEEQVPPVRHASILESILEKPKATGRKRASSEKKRKRKEEKAAAATVTQTTNGDVTSHDVNAETLSSVDATQLKEEMQEALTKRLRVEEQNNDIVVGGSTSSEQFAEVLIKEEVMLVDAPMAKNVFGEEEELPIIEIKKECSIEDEYNPLDAATTMEEH